MATTKRQRQKAARREKLAAQQRAGKLRRTRNRIVIVAVVAVVVIGTAVLLFTKNGPSTATIPTSSTTTTVATAKETCPPTTLGKGAPAFVFPSGAKPTTLVSKDIIVGTGAALKPGDKFTAQYELATYSCHAVVQSSWPAGFSATLNLSSLIPGWVKGLPGMKVGGERELIVPPTLGYGPTTQLLSSGIASNDTLVFVVNLLKIG
ncbi:MAG: hypothetical protein HKL87_02765 [Acidimicrobiaceae bacterium]|nr:hypothetical protein [Acidimicrobiaceae bacterium]